MPVVQLVSLWTFHYIGLDDECCITMLTLFPLSCLSPSLEATGYSGGGGGGGYGHDPYAQAQQPSYGYGGQQAYGGYPQQPAYGYSQPYEQQHAPQYGYGQPQQSHLYGAPASFGGMPPQQAYGGYSAAPPPPTGAGPWKSATAGDGQIYYYNEKTGETQWEKPPGMP
jgi:WW domain